MSNALSATGLCAMRRIALAMIGVMAHAPSGELGAQERVSGEFSGSLGATFYQTGDAVAGTASLGAVGSVVIELGSPLDLGVTGSAYVGEETFVEARLEARIVVNRASTDSKYFYLAPLIGFSRTQSIGGDSGPLVGVQLGVAFPRGSIPLVATASFSRAYYEPVSFDRILVGVGLKIGG